VVEEEKEEPILEYKLYCFSTRY